MKILLSIILIGIAASSTGTIVELIPVQDAYVCCCQPDVTNPNGGINYLYHGQYGACYDRTLIQWDLSGLPPDLTVISAEMLLYCEAFYGTESGNPVYFMINGEWDENTVTFNTQPDYDQSQSIAGYWPDPDTWYSVNVMPCVTAWLGGTHDNFGIYCFCEGTSGTCVSGFWSSNYSEETLRPRLAIEYLEADLDNETWGAVKVSID